MQLLIIGFDEDQTRELSRHLRADGHAVLGAQGRHGARTFIHALTPDAVVVPEGPKGVVAAGWLDDLAPALAFVPVAVSAEAGKVIFRALGGVVEDDVALPADGDQGASAVMGDGQSQAGGLFDRFDRAPDDEDEDDDEDEEYEDDEDQDDDYEDQDEDYEDDEDQDEEDDGDDTIAAVVEVLAPPVPGTRGGSDQGMPPTRDLGGAATGLAGPPRPSDQASDDEGAGLARAIHPDLASKLAHVRLGDYFSIVEVDPNASTWAIREAIERLGRRFSARGWPHRLHPEELEALDEISRGLADAMLVLGDEDLRMRYQRALAAAAQGINPSNSAR